MNLINFEIDHAYKILEGNLNDESFRPEIEVSQFVEGMVVPEMSFTAVTENLVLAAGGVYPIWDGVGEAWFISGENLKDNSIAIVRQVKKHLNSIMKQHNFHRIQAVTEERFINSKRWMGFLGMEQEGLMKKYCPYGRNFIRWAKVI